MYTNRCFDNTFLNKHAAKPSKKSSACFVYVVVFQDLASQIEASNVYTPFMQRKKKQIYFGLPREKNSAEHIKVVCNTKRRIK